LNIKKHLIGLTLIGLFLATAGAQLVSAPNEGISVSEHLGAITVQTDYITIKIVPDQAHVMWWHGNKSEADEVYKVQLVKIQEFAGDDSVLDDKTELSGIAYNLITLTWANSIVIEEDQITITLSADIPNGADIQLIMHVYNEDTPVPGTEEIVEGLTELKFDIIVNNWSFGPMAKGYAIQTYNTEIQHRHTVRVQNGTAFQNGTITRFNYESDKYDMPVAYFEWALDADIYNATDDYVMTIPVGQAFFDDLANPPTEAPGFAEGLAHLFLTYENYEDDRKMVHDPTIGVNDEAFTAPLFVWPIVAGLFAVAGVVLIIKRRK